MNALSRKREPEGQEDRRKHAMDMANLSAAESGASIKSNLIEDVTETELNIETIQLMDNMLAQDWVLSNLTEAEVHEIRWLARVMMQQLEALHPPEGSVWQGAYRAYALDDDRQSLEPLDSAQRLEAWQLLQGAITRAARGREGWQQEELSKTHKVSEVLDRDGSEDGGWV